MIYEFTATLNDGQPKNLGDYRGKVLLIVNTASQCGFTPQYAGLQAMYEKYRNRGVEILAFPCNQFGQQEPGSDQEIASFCKLDYGVSFPLFQKIEVNGDNAHPLYQYLRREAPGLLGTAIKWNFTKFLVDRQGNVVQRFAPGTALRKIERVVEMLLAK
jgi:glutathione peroxidase